MQAALLPQDRRRTPGAGLLQGQYAPGSSESTVSCASGLRAASLVNGFSQAYGLLCWRVAAPLTGGRSYPPVSCTGYSSVQPGIFECLGRFDSGSRRASVKKLLVVMLI